MAQQYGVPLLGSLPLTLGIREQADSGTPTVAVEPEGEIAARYRAIARRAAAQLAKSGRSKGFGMPKIVIQNT